MTRILLRSAKDPFTAVPAEACLGEVTLGTNSGNLLFSQAVHRVLQTEGTDVVVNEFFVPGPRQLDDYAARVNDEYDAFVVPLANAFRPQFRPHLDALTALIERLDIPVVVTGVGVQMDYNGKRPPLEMADAVSPFMKAVLDRSARVGVRGELTAQFLRQVGFGEEHVEVIGCPSLAAVSPDHRMTRKVDHLTTESDIAMSVTVAIRSLAEFNYRNALRYPNLTYIAQHTNELALMLWGRPLAQADDPRIPATTEHPLFREDRMRYFVDPSTWIDYLRTKDFLFGARIHGTIAGVLAGIPSCLIAFDSRTFELAEYHGIPYLLSGEIPDDLTAEQIYDEIDLSRFNELQPKRVASFLRFLEDNGLHHVYEAGQDGGAAFDARIASIDFAPPVRSVFAEQPVAGEEILRRFQWLESEERRISKAAKQLEKHQERLDRMVGRLDRHQARLDRQAARLDTLEGAPARARSLARRAKDRVRRSEKARAVKDALSRD